MSPEFRVSLDYSYKCIVINVFKVKSLCMLREELTPGANVNEMKDLGKN